ncbi:hypothetical protein LCGC14_1850380 [marine sediment metagenome]|uniref:Uncharacterized protein n=1 Tax=marine sediment metagenome TaxID=412755 RepID=A0A0F9GYU9_9ZZZZ
MSLIPVSPEEEARLKLEREQREELKRLQAEERAVEREVFHRCGHDFKNVTKERHGLLEGGPVPGWIKSLIEKGDRRWANSPREIWRTFKYEKCRACGIVRITRLEGVKAPPPKPLIVM